MRTTVGPLPSAVYWRRRAVVLGAVLLGIIVLFVSCSGDGDDGKTGTGAKSSQFPTPAPASPSESPDPETSFLDGVPGGNAPSLPAPGDIESPQGTDDGDDDGGSGQNTNVTVPSDGSCADSEMSVVPRAASTTIKRGASVELTLTIENIGQRTCTRDVGAGAQELYIDRGATVYWSSDTCNADKGQDVRQFAPGDQKVYKVTWNGRQSSTCAGTSANGPNPPPGQFDLRARLGSLISNPAALTIVT
jgi:hypothetical protein